MREPPWLEPRALSRPSANHDPPADESLAVTRQNHSAVAVGRDVARIRRKDVDSDRGPTGRQWLRVERRGCRCAHPDDTCDSGAQHRQPATDAAVDTISRDHLHFSFESVWLRTAMTRGSNP